MKSLHYMFDLISWQVLYVTLVFCLHQFSHCIVIKCGMCIYMLICCHDCSRVSNCLKLLCVLSGDGIVFSLPLWLFTFCVCRFVMLLLFSLVLCSKDSSTMKKRMKKKWWCKNFGLNQVRRSFASAHSHIHK